MLLGADFGVVAALTGVLVPLGYQTVPGIEHTGQGFTSAWHLAVAVIVALTVTGNYGQGHERRNPARLFVGCALAAALPLWGVVWTRPIDLVFAEYSFTTLLLWVSLLAERVLLDRVVARVARPEQNAARTVFVGTAQECRDAAQNPALDLASGHRSVGFIDVHLPPAFDALGHIDHFEALLRSSRAEAVVLSSHLPPLRIRQVADAALAAGCEMLVIPRALEMSGVEPALVRRSGHTLIELTTPRLRAQQQIVKRLLDVAGAGVGIVLLSPLLCAIAAWVRLDSPGPVLFRQARVGRGGRLFRIIKFRTMYHGAEAQRERLEARNIYGDGRLFKIRSDPRVTRVGRLLRTLSLDELPQLFNVLWGDMALVGPRPPLPSEVERYEAHHYARFDVKPGITGPWQVSGRNEITEFERVLSLETAYIRNWSLARDVAILARTIPAVLARRGAH